MASGSTIESTGTRISRSSSLRIPVSTIRHVARRPDQEAADLLERLLRGRQPDPLDLAARPPRSAARASAPGARRAWSTPPRGSRRRCTTRVPANSSWARPVSIRYSDSGVVIRMSGGSRSIAWRSRWGVSPVRTADLQVRADPAQRHAQVAVDVVGQRLERGDVNEARSASRLAAARRRLGLAGWPTGRSPTGTRPASSPTRSAPRSARARPTRSPATPAPAPASARRMRRRTTHACGD